MVAVIAAGFGLFAYTQATALSTYTRGVEAGMAMERAKRVPDKQEARMPDAQ